MYQRRSAFGFWIVQGVFVLTCGLSWARASISPGPASNPVIPFPGKPAEVVKIEREEPLRIKPLYNDPKLVSDAELAAVLKQIRPKFPPQKLKPNFAEHALRVWSVDATFRDKDVMSGIELRDVLIDNAKYLASWGAKMSPILVDTPDGVSIRWGKEECASVHHDHWLACLTEAGIRLDEPIFTPSKHVKTINDALQQALRDFRLDEREYEWSALAFGLWTPPVKSWKTTDGRTVSYDMLAERLLRGIKGTGVCQGTHRLYSMMVLVRLDDQFHILSPETRNAIMDHLRNVRQLLIESQFADGHWPSNWQEGAKAVKEPIKDEFYRTVIATGHHLEWLAIAPEELHPPRESIRKAARWAIDTTVKQTPEEILGFYTFFSHVGNALALWREQRPSDFYRAWESQHPEKAALPVAAAIPVAVPAAVPATTTAPESKPAVTTPVMVIPALKMSPAPKK